MDKMIEGIYDNVSFNEKEILAKIKLLEKIISDKKLERTCLEDRIKSKAFKNQNGNFSGKTMKKYNKMCRNKQEHLGQGLWNLGFLVVKFLNNLFIRRKLKRTKMSVNYYYMNLYHKIDELNKEINENERQCKDLKKMISNNSKKCSNSYVWDPKKARNNIFNNKEKVHKR